MSAVELTEADRVFFGLVARAVVTNPFSDERAAVDRAIAAYGGDRGEERDPVSRSVALVERRMEELRAEGLADLRLYSGADGSVLSFAFLYDVYYRYRDAFDRLIEEQLRAGEEPVPVPFAGEVFALLEARGFERRLALRYFALFFQSRRAFYFIDRALVGESPCMRALRRDLWNDIFTRDIRRYGLYLWDRMEDFSTLLLGETGTGKGAAANAIGRSGFVPFDAKTNRFVESFTRAFVSLNLSEHPETLLESELFGHSKGAFTGAVQSYEGVLATCSAHGAIFLDEIGELTGPVQVKLLRVLQERTFSPVGSRRRRSFRGRVVAATNRPLDELRDSVLREDFFYRISSDVILVPPLRQRIEEDPDELEALVKSVLTRLAGREAEELLDLVCTTIEADVPRDYPWRGNVRELEQCVRRILLRGHYAAASTEGAESGDPGDGPLAQIHEGRLDAREVLAAYCAFLYRRLGSYAGVAARTRLDPRTVKKYVEQGA